MTTMNSPSAPQKPKLLDRVREAIRSRHYSRNTEDAYIAWIKRFIFFHRKRHPREMRAPELTRFPESVLQRAVKESIRRAGVAKPASPHTFRHSGVYPALVRDHPPSGRWVRHPDRPRTPGPQRREHDDDLHPRPEPGAGGRPQPSRPPLRHRRRQSVPGSRSPCRPDMLRALAA